MMCKVSAICAPEKLRLPSGGLPGTMLLQALALRHRVPDPPRTGFYSFSENDTKQRKTVQAMAKAYSPGKQTKYRMPNRTVVSPTGPSPVGCAQRGVKSARQYQPASPVKP